MNDYKPSSRPAAFGAVAVALTAMTVGLAVVLPAKMDAGSHEVRTVSAPQPVSAPAADLDSGPIRIEVIAGRDSTWMPVHTHLTAPKSKPQGSGRLGRSRGRCAGALKPCRCRTATVRSVPI